MTTPQTALPVADPTGPESEILGNFLRISGAYLFSCVYRDSLRAAYARHAAGDPVTEHEWRYRELLIREAVSLVRNEWEEGATGLAARIPDRETVRPEA